jgi:hypothetical protein
MMTEPVFARIVPDSVPPRLPVPENRLRLTAVSVVT